MQEIKHGELSNMSYNADEFYQNCNVVRYAFLAMQNIVHFILLFPTTKNVVHFIHYVFKY